MNVQFEPQSVATLTLAADEGVATPISVAFGDGIGPEIMEASLRIMETAGANIAIEQVQLGKLAFDTGVATGIQPDAWDSIRRTKVLFKAPLTTPQGHGMKSINVTIRKSLGLFANVRPCVAYHPYITTKHPAMNVVIIRENEEDVYAGIEHRQTEDVYQCLKIVSRSGCERVIRYAFEYAIRTRRKKVSCFTKDNIMKLTDGLFHRVFDEVASEYSAIESEHLIVDAGAAKLGANPASFDVIVLPNLYGDILSDVAAEIAGSIGTAPSANIGREYAMFEAIHGSAPDLQGKGLANPSGLLLAGVMMLLHIGQRRSAQRIHNAWLRTIEDGFHTADIFSSSRSGRQVGTAEFADRVIDNLDKEPIHLTRVSYDTPALPIPSQAKPRPKKPVRKLLVGVDIFVNWRGVQARGLAETMRCASNGKLVLQMITNRGLKVWPGSPEGALKTDHWRCRFMAANDQSLTHTDLAEIQCQLAYLGIDFIKTEHLYTFDGQPGYSAGQGE